MSIITWLAGTRVGRWLAIAGVFLAALAAAWARGRRGGVQDARRKAAEKANETNTKMRDANAESRSRDVVDRLRDHEF